MQSDLHTDMNCSRNDLDALSRFDTPLIIYLIMLLSISARVFLRTANRYLQEPSKQATMQLPPSLIFKYSNSGVVSLSRSTAYPLLHCRCLKRSAGILRRINLVAAIETSSNCREYTHINQLVGVLRLELIFQQASSVSGPILQLRSSVSVPRCLKMRRTTLGPLSASAANSRGVSGPGRVAGAGTADFKAPVDRRASAVPVLGGRRQSSMAPQPQIPPGRRQSSIPSHRAPSVAYARRRTDPRPSSDRAYMQACIKGIVGFVVENGYSMPISPKILTNPTSKDFQHIFLFLMRYIDPSFSFDKRFEDEIPIIMKSMGYPFTISKSALSAVGSPHTWPTLLGVLTWILELIKYDESKAAKDMQAVDEGDILNATSQSKEDTMFIENVNAAYIQFLAGADEFPELDSELKDQFEVENVIVREEIGQLQTSISENSEVLQAMEAQAPPLQKLHEHRETLDTNIRKFKLLNSSLLDHKAGVEKKYADKSAEANSFQMSLNSVTSEIAGLQKVIAGQEQKGIDVERIAKDRANLKEALSKLSQERRVAETDHSVAKDSLAQETTNLEDGLRRYQRGAESLLLIPGSARNANGADFRITVSSDVERAANNMGKKKGPKSESVSGTTSDEHEKVLNVDISNIILPTIRELKDAFVQRRSALRNDELRLQDELDSLEESLMVMRDEHGKQLARFGNFEKDYQDEKAAMANQLKVSSDQLLMREQDLLDRRRRGEERIRESKRVVDNLAAQLRSFEESFGLERQRLGRILDRHVKQMHEHTVSIQNSTLSVCRHFQESCTPIEN
jgi:kinetochore protein NDC80